MELTGEQFYNIAALFSLAAYFMSHMLWLRILLVVASLIYIISGVSLGVGSMVGWSSAYILINLYYVITLLLDKSKINLPSNIRGIYSGPFATLSTREFKKLISMHEHKTVDNGVLFEEDTATEQLMVILDGEANVIKSGKTIARLFPGDLIGEMSFISKEPASADVVALGRLSYAYWTHHDLEKIERRNQSLYHKFISIIGYDLVKKMNQRNEHILSTLSAQPSTT
ncbi:MAG: cyclic nucleotide-binding domain-containing protein [Arenicellales bacterium]